MFVKLVKNNKMKKNLLKEYIKQNILKEYSEKVLKTVKDRWSKENQRTVSDEKMQEKINKFDNEIKPTVAKRSQKGEINLPPKFTHAGKYPITFLDWQEFNQKAKQGDPSQEIKIKGQSITVQELRQAILDANKTDNFKNIPAPLNPQDILQYSWSDIESVLDAYGTKAEKSGNKEAHTVQEADLVEIKGVPIIYNTKDLKIYEGSTYENCIKLNYAFKFKGEDNKIYSYNFCIGRKEEAANKYYDYRFGASSRGSLYRTFYFVADPTQSADIKGSATNTENFVNWYHFFVIHVFENGKFGVTDAVNQYGNKHEETGSPANTGVSWEDIGKFMVKNGGESGRIAWDKIKNLESKFKYDAPPEAEQDLAAIQGKILNFDSFEKLKRNQKRSYIAKRAKETNAFTSEMFAILDPDLKGLAINSGFIPSIDDLKGNPALGRTAATYAYKRMLTEFDKNSNKYDVKTIMPLPFIKYLSNTEKDKLLDFYENKIENITFEYIEKYFGEEMTKKYVNDQMNKLGFLPLEAVKYITNPKQKALFSTYTDVYKDWMYGKGTNVSEEDLKKAKSMPKQDINPLPFTLKQWVSMPPKNQELLLKIANKTNGNKKYSDFLTGLPYIIKDGAKEYLLLPKDKLESWDEDPSYSYSNEDNDWVLADTKGNIIINNIDKENSSICGLSLQDGAYYFSDSKEDKDDAKRYYKRVYNASDVIINGKPLSSELKESIYNNWEKYSLMRRAGILK